MIRRLLLVDDRSWSIDSIIREFEANQWEVVEADSLIDGVEALVAQRFTAAVFDRRMPRPTGAERVQLEALGIPQAWIDALNSFNIGAALGRLVSVLDLRLPYVYVSALSIHAQERPIDWPEDRAPMIDKMKVGHKITLGMQVYDEVCRLLNAPTTT